MLGSGSPDNHPRGVESRAAWEQWAAGWTPRATACAVVAVGLLFGTIALVNGKHDLGQLTWDQWGDACLTCMLFGYVAGMRRAQSLAMLAVAGLIWLDASFHAGIGQGSLWPALVRSPLHAKLSLALSFGAGVGVGLGGRLRSNHRGQRRPGSPGAG